MDCSKSAIAFLNENIMTELTKTISQLRDVPPSPSNAPENPEVETKLRTEVSDAGAKEPSNLASLSAVAPSSSSLPSESNNEPTVTTTNPSLTRPVSPDDPRLTKRWDFQVCNLEKPEWVRINSLGPRILSRPHTIDVSSPASHTSHQLVSVFSPFFDASV